MKKFLSLILAIVLVVGLLVPAVSAETGEAETKALATWTGGVGATSNGTDDVLKDVTLTMNDIGSTLKNLAINPGTAYKNIGVTPWYGTDGFNAETAYGYL